MVIEADNVVGGRGLIGIVHTDRCQVERRTVQRAEHWIVFIADVQHFVAAALSWRGVGNVVGILEETAPFFAAQIRQAIDCQPAETVTTDQHVITGQPVGPGKRRDVGEQLAERFTHIVFRVILWTQCRQQVIDDIADGVTDLAFTRATGAAKGDADFREVPLGVVFTEDFHLGAGIAGLVTKEGSPCIDFAVITQLRGGDGCPTGFLYRVQCGLFRIGVPGDTGNHPLGVGAANQRGHQRCRQAHAETVVLVTGGKAVVEVVIGVQRDCHRVGEQRFGVFCTKVLVVVHTHGYCLSLCWNCQR
ncbi:hypothetical protein D3C80_701220 [compost metagenome]